MSPWALQLAFLACDINLHSVDSDYSCSFKTQMLRGH